MNLVLAAQPRAANTKIKVMTCLIDLLQTSTFVTVIPYLCIGILVAIQEMNVRY